MKILVTGASGFVGRELCRTLCGQDMSVRAALRTATQDLPVSEQSIVGSIAPDTDWTQALAGVDAVVHLAARVHVMRDRAVDPSTEFRTMNVAATEHLARSAAACGVRRLVFMSSVKVNGETSLADSGLSESDPPAPADPYGRSKWEAELALQRIAATTSLEYVVLRPPLVYGPGVKANFLSLMRWIAGGVPLPLGAIRNHRSLVYVANLTDAIRVCLTDPRAANRTFMISDGEDLSTPELIRRLAGALQRPARIFPVPGAWLSVAARITGQTASLERLSGSLRVDSSGIRRTLDWLPPYSVDQGLRETAQWFAAQRAR